MRVNGVVSRRRSLGISGSLLLLLLVLLPSSGEGSDTMDTTIPSAIEVAIASDIELAIPSAIEVIEVSIMVLLVSRILCRLLRLEESMLMKILLMNSKTQVRMTLRCLTSLSAAEMTSARSLSALERRLGPADHGPSPQPC